MPDFLSGLPKLPSNPFSFPGDTYRWSERLSVEEKELIVNRLMAPGYLPTPILPSSQHFRVSDRQIAAAIQADFTDAEHNLGKPWHPAWVERWRAWEIILDKLHYSIDITYKVRKLP